MYHLREPAIAETCEKPGARSSGTRSMARAASRNDLPGCGIVDALRHLVARERQALNADEVVQS
jgi:hypothetical protein